ncbi:MAG: Metallo-beta-lactamase superfamily protein [Candidatus Omnitrophica bacterium ADurb.Bin277]|nr:MAG: Metallo-beta-lactamase superfamily protein [Candidatus Omnitrophica bacterium ADurb.Bin277]
MKITLIAEGSAKKDRKALRWGISFLVGNVLFDTFGRADIFEENVCRYKIDLSQVRHVVISHEDWDHIAGLENLLRKRPKMKVFLCKKTGHVLKKIVRDNGGSLTLVDSPRRIAPGVFSLGQMRADTGRGILYEQALVVKSRNGFSVITGCAHPGIVRIIKRAIRCFGKNIYAVCGGFHMKDNSREENLGIIGELQRLGVKKVIPLHCTGAPAFRLFKRAFKNNCLQPNRGGTLKL